MPLKPGYLIRKSQGAPRHARGLERGRTAFTLVELLVVMAIISLLASMMMPSLTRAREMARRTKCQSNMLQIYHTFMFYWMDYDERFPHYLDPSEKSPMNEWNWKLDWYLDFVDTRPSEDGFIGNYRRGIFCCPSSARSSNLGYGMNVELKYKSLGRFYKRETETVLIGEPVGKNDREEPAFGLADPNCADYEDESSLVDMDRHRNGANYLYLEGHVSWSPKPWPIADESQSQETPPRR